ncbi:MAG: hypothetical protein U0176_07310 [Bacteroidia bacterium]
MGFTGTPIDATLDVFGKVVDTYTMTESVRDEITVRIVHEGGRRRYCWRMRSSTKSRRITNAVRRRNEQYQIEESKRAMAQMRVIIGDRETAACGGGGFYQRIMSGGLRRSVGEGKAMFVQQQRSPMRCGKSWPCGRNG